MIDLANKSEYRCENVGRPGLDLCRMCFLEQQVFKQVEGNGAKQRTQQKSGQEK